MKLIIKPKFRGFICTTAHPEGCKANVHEQIQYVKKQGKVNGPKNVLVIGAATGYGLSSRIVSAFGSGASTIGVFFEKAPSGNRTGTAGWYNTAAFEEFAAAEGIYAKSINGDAFSNDIKNQTVELIKRDLGKVDMVVYSLAAPRRTLPDTGETVSSVLKPVGETYTSKTVDFHTAEVSEITIEPATEEEVKNTVSVMGGEDWELWIDLLMKEGVLSEGFKTVAYSYIGPKVTHAVYREGAIGKAKDHLEKTAKHLTEKYRAVNGNAWVSVNKALVTQSSSAIPVVSLYASILFKIMKEKNLHEGCIEQIYRLYKDKLYSDKTEVDSNGLIRIDDLEMKQDVQDEVEEIWNKVNTENIHELSDIDGYRKDFFRLFGFENDEINYDADVNIEVNIPSLKD
jgi:Uncharacterized paraquat-inducible protein B